MNEIVNNFFLTRDKFMPKLHLKQLRFCYSACGPFTKHCERIQKFKETVDLNISIIKNAEKACFVHDAGYASSKDLAKKIISDKLSKDRAYKIALNPRYVGKQKGLASMVY